MRVLWILFLLCACSSRNYTYYLLDVPVEKSPVLKEEGTPLRPQGFGSSTYMKVRWNDGQILTEVDVPMLSTGQRIVVEHSANNAQVKTLQRTRLVPPPPSRADASVVEAYRTRGLRVNEGAPEVSILKTRGMMQEANKAGNYQLALEYAELVLEKYPSHPEFLRAKASILLLMGERDKAIEIYEQAEEVESDPVVRKKLEELQKTQK